LVKFMTAVLPPYTDSLRSAQYISQEIGTKQPSIEWVAVRPDSFIDGEPSAYTILDSIQHPFYESEYVTMANIAHFMGELVNNPVTWTQWKFKMPIIIDTNQPAKK